MTNMFWKIKTNYQIVIDKLGKLNHSDVQEFNQ